MATLLTTNLNYAYYMGGVLHRCELRLLIASSGSTEAHRLGHCLLVQEVLMHGIAVLFACMCSACIGTVVYWLPLVCSSRVSALVTWLNYHVTVHDINCVTLYY